MSILRHRWSLVLASLAVALPLGCHRVPEREQTRQTTKTGPALENGTMTTEASSATPYEIEANVWRNEQPGDTPSLHVSVTFRELRAPAWKDLRLQSLALTAGTDRWHPTESTLQKTEHGFSVSATGAPSLPGGTLVTLKIEFDTADGPKTVTLPGLRIDVIF